MMLWRQVKVLSRKLIEMKKKKLEKHEKSDHKFINRFWESILRYKHNKHLFYQDEYYGDFGDPTRDEINVD
jgi:hypothetical protein